MTWILVCSLMVVAYLLLFFAFGSLITGRLQKENTSTTLTVLTGFFLYYSLFQIVAVPMALMQRPLNELSFVWLTVVLLVLIVSVVTGRKRMLVALRGTFGALTPRKKSFMELVYGWTPVILVLVQIAITTIWTTDFWDNAYYIGDVSMSVFTNTIGLYDPLSGELRQTIDIRHFFAMYNMQDAVVCDLTGIHPLIETKTIMGAVVMIITNILYYKIGQKFFHGEKKAVAIFMFLAFTINLFSYTQYNTSGFLFLRTYEGKTILGNVLIPAVMYVMMLIYEDYRDKGSWLLLFTVGFAACALSSSAMILMPVAIGAFALPLSLMKRDFRVLLRSVICMVPSLVVMVCYFLSRLGILVIHV